MRFNLYTVYDKVGEEAGSPFIAKTDGIAARQFVFAFKNSQRPEFRIQDHVLNRIGTFDNESMALTQEIHPVKVDLSCVDVEVEGESQTV